MSCTTNTSRAVSACFTTVELANCDTDEYGAGGAHRAWKQRAGLAVDQQNRRAIRSDDRDKTVEHAARGEGAASPWKYHPRKVVVRGGLSAEEEDLKLADVAIVLGERVREHV